MDHFPGKIGKVLKTNILNGKIIYYVFVNEIQDAYWFYEQTLARVNAEKEDMPSIKSILDV